ncbi:MAG: RNA polymerase sigma factor [Acidobacteriota bacterium]
MTRSANAAAGPRLAFSARRHRDQLHAMDDRELLGAMAGDDEAALDVLIERKTGPLLQHVGRLLGGRGAEDARDIVQLTFLRVWDHRARYDARWSPNTWIYRIASNLTIDHLRAQRSRDRIAEPVRVHLRDMAAERAARDQANLHEGEVAKIFELLADELTEKQRAIFLLREVEGLPASEVAKVVGCRASTVRNHLFNARRVLKEALLRRFPEYARRHQQARDAANGREEDAS